MAIMTHAKFRFNWLMLTLIFGIWASEPPPPRAWQTTEKAGPDRVNVLHVIFLFTELKLEMFQIRCHNKILKNNRIPCRKQVVLNYTQKIKIMDT